jgi:hypothetical protein
MAEKNINDTVIGTEISDTDYVLTSDIDAGGIITRIPLSVLKTALDLDENADPIFNSVNVTTDSLIVAGRQVTKKWKTGLYYAIDTGVIHNGIIYLCQAGHTAASISEPGIGSVFASYWITPGQNAFALKTEVLTKTNTTAYTPTGDYNPATKKYVADAIVLGSTQQLASPIFTGTPAAPTAANNTNTTQLATTAFAKREADDAQSFAIQRANHTGTQSRDTIVGLSADMISLGLNLETRILLAEKGVANGVATLDESGLVPTTQLPSYVDSVVEYANLASFPATGVSGVIYIALDTNKTYRWSGAVYTAITSGAVDSVAGKTGVVTLVKADVGLSNVDDTTDVAKPISTAQATAIALKSNTASPTFTGVPAAPTAAITTNTTQLATTAFVNAEIANDAAPLAHVGAGAAAHAVATTSVHGFLSSTDKTKLDSIASGATVAPVTSVATRIGDVVLAKSDVGLSNVDNTSDAAKPVSTAQQTALNLKANLASPTFTGTPIAPTAATITNTTQVATTAFVKAQGYSTTTGTVTGVTGTAPVVSSGGATPAISMAAATAAANGYMTSIAMIKLDSIADGAQVNAATNLTATAGTTAGPIINSSTGANVVIPSASATASGVVTTGAQTFAGTKTFVTPVLGAATGTSFNSITGLSSTAPIIAGTAAVGNLTTAARGNHVHPAQTAITGNAATATKLATARNINGVAFDGTADITIIGAVSSVAGKTGAVTLVKADVGLTNVDDTTDASKPVSTAQQTALNLKANIASPTFTGTVAGITKDMVGLGNVANTPDIHANVKSFGAVGNGTTDDTAAIASALASIATSGGTLYFPAGSYLTGTITIDMNATDNFGGRVSVKGAGMGVSRLIIKDGAVDGISLINTTAAPTDAEMHSWQFIADINIARQSVTRTGAGIAGDNLAYLFLQRVYIGGFAIGVYATDILSTTMLHCAFKWNGGGVRFERGSSGYLSDPNAITMVGCNFGLNDNYGMWCVGGATICITGGAFEGNGLYGSAATAGKWGLKISNTGAEGGVGVSLNGIYFEHNKGTADVWIGNTLYHQAHQIAGCSFGSISSTNYVINNVKIESSNGIKTNVNLSGCGFIRRASYVVSATRMAAVWSGDSVNVYNWGCTFDSVTDTPVFTAPSGSSNPESLFYSGVAKITAGSTTVTIPNGNTLKVGTTGLTSPLEVAGNTIIGGNIFINGIVDQQVNAGTNEFAAPVACQNGLVITGAATVSTTFGVTGNTSIGGNVFVNGVIDQQVNIGTNEFNAPVACQHGVVVTGAATISTTLGVTGTATVGALSTSGVVTSTSSGTSQFTGVVKATGGFWGNAGTYGAKIATRGGNVFSIDWDGTNFKFYIDNILKGTYASN